MKKRFAVSVAALFGILAFASNCGWCRPGARPVNAHPSCGGERIAKPGGGYWTCTFDEEFNGRKLDASQWTTQLTSTSAYYTGPQGTRACYVDTPHNVSVSGGYLSLTARKESAPFTCINPDGNFTTQYTAGMVSTVHNFNQIYGRFEFRAKLPDTVLKGVQETLWLWPAAQTYGQFPNSGEIDVAEFYSQFANRDIPYIHYVYDPSTADKAKTVNIVTASDCSIDYKKFNVYTAIWEPGTITLMYNGKTCLVDKYIPSKIASPAPFDKPFFVVLTQALGIQTNAFDPATTPLPATFKVDYIRIWK